MSTKNQLYSKSVKLTIMNNGGNRIPYFHEKSDGQAHLRQGSVTFKQQHLSAFVKNGGVDAMLFQRKSLPLKQAHAGPTPAVQRIHTPHRRQPSKPPKHQRPETARGARDEDRLLRRHRLRPGVHRELCRVPLHECLHLLCSLGVGLRFAVLSAGDLRHKLR